MNSNLLILSIFIIFISCLSSILILPYVHKYGLKFGIFDSNEQRKSNFKYLVRFGGLAIVLPFYFSLILAFFITKLNFFDLSLNLYSNILPCLIIGIFFYFIGLLDDIFFVSPFLRLFLQIVAVILLIYWGFHIEFNLFNDFNFINENFPNRSFNIFITIIFLVGLTNSFNWIDGLDGLASGVTAIVNLGYLLISLFSNNYVAIILASCSLGASIGFLKYNFYPSKMIMGDGGSYFLGFMSGIVGIFAFGEINQDNIIVFDLKNFLLLFLILFLPIFDMTMVILRRLKNGKSPFYPDRAHLHHFLYDFGINHRNTVFLIYFLCQWFVCLAVNFKIGFNLYTIIFSSLILIIYSIFTFYKFLKKI